MRTIKSLLAALVLISFSASGQTADEVIDKYITALGGKDKLASLKSVKMEGVMNAQGTDVNLTITKVHNTGLRMDLEVMGVANYQVLNAKSGAVFMPIMGMAEPQPMDADQFKSGLAQLDVHGSLVSYKEKGSTVSYEGMDKVEGAEAHKLKLTNKDGVVSYYFIDTKNNRLVKASSKRMVNGQEMEIETVFSDFKQNADGYWFPYTTASTQGTTNFDKIETNITVDPKIFEN